MALLTVLLLLAVIGALMTAALETVSHAVHLATNARISTQSRYYAGGIELMALHRLETIAKAAGGHLSGDGWLGQPIVLETSEGGKLIAIPTDGGNCFNLNSLADGDRPDALVPRPRGIAQFVALATSLGIAGADARRIAGGIADWIDADSVPDPLGGEDDSYRRLSPAYLPANRLLAEASEIRAVAGVTPALYDLLRPWVCALPTTDMSPVNLNTLQPSQAPLLAMILPGRLSVDAARQILMQRPPGGWRDVLDFWRQEALAGLQPSGQELDQPKLITRYFNLDIRTEQSGFVTRHSALLDVLPGRSRILSRRWTADE